ncbi:MAG: hypothetical protein ACPG5Z_15580 [Pseudoalteromonas sp.]
MAVPNLIIIGIAYGVLTAEMKLFSKTLNNVVEELKATNQNFQQLQITTTSLNEKVKYHEQRIRDLEHP